MKKGVKKIETSGGVCESCDSVNPGCYEYHYEIEYPNDYIGFKLNRRFISDYCEDVYTKINGKCFILKQFFFDDCKKYDIDIQNNKFKWIKYKENSSFYLRYCVYPDFYGTFVRNNKLSDCNDVNDGGVENFDSCEVKKWANKLLFFI